MADQRKLFNRVRGEKSAEEVMHSSGFAQVQSQHYGSDGCGSTPGSFADQRAADERRRYIKGYENARLVRGAYTAERARAYVPRTRSEFGSGISRAGRDTSGDGISGSLIGRKISN
ncbi:hypothetical protein IJ103_04160 [Candidatus Saccharibacteria bacterium]|nr:hypothetical protein [Candidatus Saccharibacteria bacterium]